jgi:predicted metal-dependent peptidase
MTSLEIIEKYGLYRIGLYQSANADGEGGGIVFRMSMSKIWEDIAQRMQTDIEVFCKNRGDIPGCLIQNIKAVNREKYDYTEFLKKFAVMGEIMKVNDDEFDYVFYTYGLQIYKNMPLIEPVEYKETKAIKEFVIAIDTSGSVAGELVQRFVQKTYNILKSTESFFTKTNLHIIQRLCM